MTDEKKQFKATQLGLHAVKNVLGMQQQADLFSEHHQDFCEEFGVKLEGNIDRFGVDLTDIQSRVMEGILYGFSKTAYKGNVEPTSKEQLIDQKYDGKTPAAYKYIQEVPRIRATQSEILEWSGINRGSIATVTRALEAIQELGRKQYCFYYDRLALDGSGNPHKDKRNKWVKEEVVSVDTLFTIKEVRDKDSGSLKYYEIMPSAVFLDQRESYFMFIPLNWREEVKQLVGNKKASSYTFRFLLFLRYQYELKRRSKQLSPPYSIKWSPEEIAMAIKMPQSVYIRKKKRANEILEDAYIVAKRLGYLSDFNRLGHLDILMLNEQKYFNSKGVKSTFTEVFEENPSSLLPSALALFDLFHSRRKLLDKQYQVPEGSEKSKQLLVFQELLRKRQLEDIEKLIIWSASKKYWCTRLSTPEKFSEFFSEAWMEMLLSTEEGQKVTAERNKDIAKEIVGRLKDSGLRIDLLSNYVEIVNEEAAGSIVLEYNNKNFEDLFRKAIRKCGINI